MRFLQWWCWFCSGIWHVTKWLNPSIFHAISGIQVLSDIASYSGKHISSLDSAHTIQKLRTSDVSALASVFEEYSFKVVMSFHTKSCISAAGIKSLFWLVKGTQNAYHVNSFLKLWNHKKFVAFPNAFL